MTRYSNHLKVAFFIIGVAFSVLLFVLVLNTVVARQKRFPWDNVSQIKDTWMLDHHHDMTRAKRLAKSLTFQTITYEHGNHNFPEFLKLHKYIRESMYHNLLKKCYINLLFILMDCCF